MRSVVKWQEKEGRNENVVGKRSSGESREEEALAYARILRAPPLAQARRWRLEDHDNSKTALSHQTTKTPKPPYQNWNCASSAYPSAAKCPSSARIIPGGPQRSTATPGPGAGSAARSSSGVTNPTPPAQPAAGSFST
jgi:hypothetical protein